MVHSISSLQTALENDLGILEEVTVDVGLEPPFQRPTAPVGVRRKVFEELSVDFAQDQITPILASAGNSYKDPCHLQHHVQGHHSSRATIDGQQHIAATPTPSRVGTVQELRPLRLRRPAVDSETFQPLESVREEASLLTNSSDSEPPALLYSFTRRDTDIESRDPLKQSIVLCSISDQVERHLAGDFDWLLSYSIHDLPEANNHLNQDSVGRDVSSKLYGCNVVSQRTRRVLTRDIETSRTVHSYHLLATPLEKHEIVGLGMDEPKIIVQDGSEAWDQIHYPATPLKVPEIVQAVENAVSPSLTVLSDRSGSYGDGSSRTGSFSLPRIEDSLEELDKLEDELEKLGDFARLRQLAASADKSGESQSSKATSKVSKQTPVAGLSATVRSKGSAKVPPVMRRTSSLAVQNKRQGGAENGRSQQPSSAVTQTKPNGVQSTTPRLPARSSKAPTVAKFELPGEAVARRLKEQREARQAQQAQQAETTRPSVSASKPRQAKPLAKPTFELPGEAISRRKREEREAKLRAQEEEERRRREFKARPMKPIGTPSTVPRETIASRARQVKIQEEAAEKQAVSSVKTLRSSLCPGNVAPITPTAKPHQLRGRTSVLVANDSSRATSTSTGSLSGKPGSTSVGDGTPQRLTGKEVYVRDNNGVVEKRERERRDREMAAKTAREQAAERSRVASREWAEKRRRKEAALRQGAQ